jgi:hypothetical protein
VLEGNEAPTSIKGQNMIRKRRSELNKNKLNKIIAIILSVIILTVGSVVIFQIGKNHQANELIIDKCFENFDKEGKVVVKKNSFWSPVSCEKE